MTAKEQAEHKKAVIFDNYADLARLWADICADHQINVIGIISTLTEEAVRELKQKPADIVIVRDPGQEAVDVVRQLGAPITIIGIWELDRLQQVDFSVYLHHAMHDLPEALSSYLLQNQANNSSTA